MVIDLKYRSIPLAQKNVVDLSHAHTGKQVPNTWGMKFNPSKCNLIHIIKGTNLDAVDNATYLGINI